MGAVETAATVTMSRLPEVVDWLATAGVPLRRIAEVAGLKPANVRKIVSRHRQRRPRCAGGTLGVFVDRSRTRPVTRASGRRGAHSEELEAALSNIVRSTWLRHDFNWGIKELTLLGQYLGFFSQPGLVSVAAERQFHLSAFNVHLGRTTSAIGHARDATRWYRQLISLGDRSRGLRGECNARELVAHAQLLDHRPMAALNMLAEVETVSRQHGLTLGAEFYRKRGVSYLQLPGPDRERDAKQAFTAAMAAPHSVDTMLERRMSGERHLNLLNRSFDESAELLQDAIASYGKGSLQHSMCVHWSAAIALATDSQQLNQHALDSMVSARAVVSQFGHQATISFLLSRTAEFGVPRRFRKEWVRLALYSNAFRGD